MTAYNGQYRCSGSKTKVRRWYKDGEFAVCHVCDRGPLHVYTNGRIVVHKAEHLLPAHLQ